VGRHDLWDMGQPRTIDADLAQRCVIDVTTVLRRYRREINGMRRVELETARALLGAGGRAVAIDADGGLRAISRDHLAAVSNDTTPPSEAPASAIASGWKALAAIGDKLGRRAWTAGAAVLPFVPRAGDVLLLFGEYWTPQLLDAIRAIRRARSMRIVPLVHDIMPIRRPELFWNSNPGWDNDKFFRIFRESVRAFIETGDRIIAISEHSRADLIRFCGEQGWSPPGIGVAPLASNLDRAVAPMLTPRLREMGLGEHAFALMVSNIEPRKNHIFAYGLWRALAQRLGVRTIPLVLAGHRGWQSNDLLVRLEHDAQMWGRHIRLIEASSDAELAWLYSNAAFTIFPSELEGWGLPITESLAFDTPCLAADNSSLREASQGLAWHADTLDGRAWLQEAERCMLDPAHLAAAKAAIKAKFVKRRWEHFVADVLREVQKASLGDGQRAH